MVPLYTTPVLVHIPSQWEGLQGVTQEEEMKEDTHHGGTKYNHMCIA